MTSREKRALRKVGLDWREVEQARFEDEMQVVEYTVVDGVLVPPEDPEQAVIAHAAAALDLHLHGRLTGSVEVPLRVLERCIRDVVKYVVGNC